MTRQPGPRMTLPTVRVLRALLADPTQEMYGLQICTQVRLPSGTVYPILARLERLGWLESRWEKIDARAEGRPRRRYYKLTREGAERAIADGVVMVTGDTAYWDWPVEPDESDAYCMAWKPPKRDRRFKDGLRWELCWGYLGYYGSPRELLERVTAHAQTVEHGTRDDVKEGHSERHTRVPDVQGRQQPGGAQ